MKKLLYYLNPIQRLGNTRYAFWFPLIFNISLCLLSEFYAYYVAHDPNIVGRYIIFTNIAAIIYFSFRDGIRGGLITSGVTIIYYLYIIQTRHYVGEQLTSGVETTFFLALLYLLLGGTVGWLKETIDKSIEREANEKRRLQAIVQQLPVGIIITDSQGRIIQANKKVESIFGVKIPIGFVIGKDKPLVKSIYKNKPALPSHSPLIQAINTQKSVVGKEFEIERKDGKSLTVNINASAIHNRRGEVIAAASIIYDMTQQKELEKRKDDFVNMASHELKTPITSMKLYIDSLLSKIKKFNDPKAEKILESIKYQTEKLQELVSELLDVSRIQTGKLMIKKEIFDMQDLIEETINGLQSIMKNHKIILSKTVPLSVSADKFRIYQVLTNLIVNAVKYSPTSEKIIIKLYKKKQQAIISVEDFGIGISNEQKLKIFERLYQVVDAKEKTFPGLGMGLYIAKQIIKKHQGKIWVESEKNKGSIFYFSLPIKTNQKK